MWAEGAAAVLHTRVCQAINKTLALPVRGKWHCAAVWSLHRWTNNFKEFPRSWWFQKCPDPRISWSPILLEEFCYFLMPTWKDVHKTPCWSAGMLNTSDLLVYFCSASCMCGSAEWQQQRSHSSLVVWLIVCYSLIRASMASGGAEGDGGGIPLDIDNVHLLLQGQSMNMWPRKIFNTNTWFLGKAPKHPDSLSHSSAVGQKTE